MSVKIVDILLMMSENIINIHVMFIKEQFKRANFKMDFLLYLNKQLTKSLLNIYYSL